MNNSGSKPAMNLQDSFLNHVRKENLGVIIYLINGFQIRGLVRGFDNFTVIIENEGKQQLVYKHAISTISPGLNTMTGGRVKRIQKYIGNETFMMTYGDGVCDVNIQKLLDFHKAHGKLATLTAVMLEQSKGILNIDGDNAVRSFREKSIADSSPINAGFMVLEPQVFDYLENDATVFERGPLEKLAAANELMSYIHKGFWQCMDTKREKDELESLWSTVKAPWKVWGE